MVDVGHDPPLDLALGRLVVGRRVMAHVVVLHDRDLARLLGEDVEEARDDRRFDRSGESPSRPR